jgi:hypothetical protein
VQRVHLPAFELGERLLAQVQVLCGDLACLIGFGRQLVAVVQVVGDRALLLAGAVDDFLDPLAEAVVAVFGFQFAVFVEAHRPLFGVVVITPVADRLGAERVNTFPTLVARFLCNNFG